MAIASASQMPVLNTPDTTTFVGSTSSAPSIPDIVFFPNAVLEQYPDLAQMDWDQEPGDG